MEITLASKLKTKLFFDEFVLNNWLSRNPDTEVVDIKIAANGPSPALLIIYLKEVS